MLGDAGLQKDLAGKGGTATLDVDPGDEITCTFFNTQDATVEIVKDATPADGTDFDYTGRFGGFMLDDGGADDAVKTSETFAIPATSVGSIAPSRRRSRRAGRWRTSRARRTPACRRIWRARAARRRLESTRAIRSRARSSTSRTRRSTIVKDADPGRPQDFAFSSQGLDGGFTLDDDDDARVLEHDTFDVDGDQIGTKTVTEGTTAGWDLTGIRVLRRRRLSSETRDGDAVVDPGDDDHLHVQEHEARLRHGHQDRGRRPRPRAVDVPADGRAWTTWTSRRTPAPTGQPDRLRRPQAGHVHALRGRDADRLALLAARTRLRR